MGLFSDIISAIGNAASDVFGGGSNDDQKRKQNTPVTSNNFNPGARVNLPSIFKAPTNLGAGQNNTQNNTPIFTQPTNNNIPLTAGSPTTNATPTPQHTSLFGHLLNGVKDVGEGAAGVGAGTAAGVIRAGEGMISGAADIPNIVVHAVTKPARMIGSPDNPFVQDLNKVDQQSQRVTNDVTDPVNWMAQKTDMIPGMLNHEDGTSTIAGRFAHDIYTPAQVATNIATVIPAATAIGAKVASMAGDASKAGDILNSANAFAQEQRNIPNLSKVPVLGRLLSKVPGIGEGGEVATDENTPTSPENTPPESGIKPPEELAPTNAPSSEPTAPTTTPGAPESGIKPVATPAPTTPTVTAPVETPVVPPVQAPLQPTVAPADVANAEKTAQQAVDKTAETPQPAPAPETAAPNITPTQAASEQVAASPEQQVVDEAPNLNKGLVDKDLQGQLASKTGDTGQDLQNSTALVSHLLNNTRDFAPEEGAKNPLQRLLDVANGHLHSNSIVSKMLNSRLGSHLSEGETNNVIDAIETKNAANLTPKEAEVYNAIKGNIETPSDVTRSGLDSEYQSQEGHFAQVRQNSVKGAIQQGSRAKGLSSKIKTTADLLDQNSRFSKNSTLGKFTDANGKTIIGDGDKLGLTSKGDGTFVDKNKNVYDYSRATTKELKNAGVKLQSGKDALASYVHDTLNLKTRADAQDYLIKNAEDLGLSKEPAAGKSEVVTLKGADGKETNLFTDPKTAKDIEESGITNSGKRNASLPVRAFNAVTNAVMQSTVMNPTAHSLNLATNAFVRGGIGALGRAVKPIDEAAQLRMSDAGVHFPTYGKNSASLLSNLTHGATKLNERAISALDAHTRAGLFEKLTTKDGMTDKQAAKMVNDWMGGRSTYSSGKSAQLGIFWRYFVRQNVNAARIINDAAHGSIKPLANAAIAGLATYEADKGMQAATGNKNASFHAPGVIGIANDYLKSGNALSHGQFRNSVNPLVNHINPVLTTGAEQTLGVDNYGNKFNNTTDTRLNNVLGISPVTNAFNNNGHSLAEKALNTFGAYTPHIKGDMAAKPGTIAGNILNVNNAQNGSTIAFPNDFTGKQSSDAMNNSGLKYSTKTAAEFNSQSQSQQQAVTSAVRALKPLGITSVSDIKAYAKLASGDQKNYSTAAQQILKSGASISNATLRSQLVKNGNVDTAANLDTSIPSSLSQQDKTALETYSTAGNSGQKNVWLQDNDNANNYYSALINQKIATNSLTNEDKDTSGTWSGTGNTLAVKSLVAQTNKQFNVPQNIQQLYEDTTKSQYDKMSGAQKDALTNYAAQLNKNGVIDKFGIGNGTSGSSKSSASARNRAAGIASGDAVVKPGTATGIKVGTAKYVAPTLAVAKASTAKSSNPFVRSISATAGVK